VAEKDGEPTFAEALVNGMVAPIPDPPALAPSGEVRPKGDMRGGARNAVRVRARDSDREGSGKRRAGSPAQARQLTKAGCRKVFRDVHVSGAKSNRAQLRRLIDHNCHRFRKQRHAQWKHYAARCSPAALRAFSG